MTTEQQVWLQAYCAAIMAEKMYNQNALADECLKSFKERFPTEHTPQKECTKVEHQGLIDTEAMTKAWGKYYCDQSYSKKREPIEMDFKEGFIAALRYVRGEK